MSELLKKSQAAIGKRNRVAGKSFERKVAKRIARNFGWPWKEAFDRAGSGHEQSHDAITLSPYADRWPYWWECKYRQGWSFDQFFKNPETARAYVWFKEAIDNTAIDNLDPLLVFSSPHKPIYVMARKGAMGGSRVLFLPEPPVCSFRVGSHDYFVFLLDEFLASYE